MESKITRRIMTEAGFPGLFPFLTEQISGSDLQSLLLSVYQIRARNVRESDILTRFGRSPLLAPSSVDARLLNQFDRVADSAAGFDAVDLSPVSPFGMNFALGSVDQNSILTTIRNAEVLGDPTPAMALECARRRRSTRKAAPVRLCTSHRVIRLQPFETPGFTPHFRLFALASAGRNTGSNSFEIQHLSEHIRFYLGSFRSLNTQGFSLANPLVELSDVSITRRLLGSFGISEDEVRNLVRAHRPGSSERLLQNRGITFPDVFDDPWVRFVEQRILHPLQQEFPEAQFRFKLDRLEGLAYYTGLCLRISPTAPDGIQYPVADGGFTDWTARLLQDKKERLLTSGIGSEFICRRYRTIPL